MKLVKTLLLLAFVGFAPIAAPLAGQETEQGEEETRSTNDGVFTAEQADAGKGVFADWCMGCHDVDYFYATEFVQNWVGRSMRSLYNTVAETMPEDLPGGLSKDEYASVIAYVLQLNAYPVGPVPLPSDEEELRSIMIERLELSR